MKRKNNSGMSVKKNQYAARTLAKAPAKRTTKKKVVEEDDTTTLREFLVDSIKDIYWAEKHLLKALPKMAKASTTEELKDAFNEHLEATRGHVERIEQVFELLEEKPQAKKCDAMEGLTKEAESIISETTANTLTRDAALIIAAQKVEHYEIATYGGLVHLSRTLGEDEVADILATTLEEEKQTDETLSQLADEQINAEALQDSSDEDEESEEDEE